MITIINTVLSFALIAYVLHRTSKDKSETVRELTKAMLSKNLQEYVEVIPEDNEDEEIQEEDELEDIYAVDEKVLIKHLREQHEDFEDKN